MLLFFSFIFILLWNFWTLDFSLLSLNNKTIYIAQVIAKFKQNTSHTKYSRIELEPKALINLSDLLALLDPSSLKWKTRVIKDMFLPYNMIYLISVNSYLKTVFCFQKNNISYTANSNKSFCTIVNCKGGHLWRFYCHCNYLS